MASVAAVEIHFHIHGFSRQGQIPYLSAELARVILGRPVPPLSRNLPLSHTC